MFSDKFDFSLYDKELYSMIKQEEKRQQNDVNLIASENYVHPAIMKLQGSVLTNKYAEGYPGRRYYGGCKYVDMIENIAIDRAKILFKADYVNVQPHSGSQANAAVYFALLDVNDTVLSMSLSSGGHLTHGSTVNFSGKLLNFVHYELDSATGDLNYELISQLAYKYRPKMIVAGFSAFSGILNWSKFRDIANSVNAYLMVDMAHISGLVAAGLYPNPISFADVVTSTTHKTLRGPRGGLILAKFNDNIEKKLQTTVFPGMQGGPLMHVIAAKALSFKDALTCEFVNYQKQVLKNAKIMAKIIMSRGFKIVSQGTKNHQFLIDLRDKNITGQEAENTLEKMNIIVNKNLVPNDIHSSLITSGLRIGTPAITTRGFKEEQCIDIGNWIADVLYNIIDDNVTRYFIMQIKSRVHDLCNNFPIYS